MNNSALKRLPVLWQRELRNYPATLVWTPVVMAAVLSVLLGVMAILSNELQTLGGTIFEAVVEEGSAGSMNISFDFEAAGAKEQAGFEVIDESGPVDEEAWNFSREWNFELEEKEESPEPRGAAEPDEANTINPFLNLLHNVFMLALYFISFWYLLGSLFNDRRDSSILFWKSMPVSDWEEVLARLTIVLLVAPAIFIGVSMVTQFLVYHLVLAMVEESEFRRVIDGNVSFMALYLGQLQAWLLTALWVVPMYSWVMLASAGARRSPFLLAVVPLIVLVILERIFLPGDWISNWIGDHLPHGGSEGVQGVGIYRTAPNWAGQSWASIASGLVFAAAALWACVWLRRQRIEAG